MNWGVIYLTVAVMTAVVLMWAWVSVSEWWAARPRPPAPRRPSRRSYQVWESGGECYLSCDDAAEVGPSEFDVPGDARHLGTLFAASHAEAVAALEADGVTVAEKPAMPPGWGESLG